MRNFNYHNVETTQEGIMSKVYLCMTFGLVISGIMAYFFATTPELANILYSTTVQNEATLSVCGWVVLFAPLAMIFGLGWVMRQSLGTVMGYFIIFCALMGASLSSVFMIYTTNSILLVFFLTAGMFAGMSVFGFVTKKDLSSMGSMLIMTLWGLILAMMVNIFLQSDKMDFIISFIAVLVFVGLTAYDTQKIKQMMYECYDEDSSNKMAILGALRLYLDFINLFLHLLRLLGTRK